MANTTFYNRGDAYHDSAGNPAIIKRGNELIFTEHFNAGGGSELTPATAGGVLSVASVNYSTNEHLTGRKWIDGKDIYEKTISLGALPNNSEIQVDHNITFETVVDYIAIAQNSAGAVLKMPFLSPTTSNNVGATINATKVTVFTGSDRSGFTGYCTIYYTKPTPAEQTNNRTVKKTVKKG